MQRSGFRFAIFAGGFVAGALDIAYACARGAMNAVSPERVLQSVASGLLGRPAYDGGAATALLGLGLHFAMTGLMAAAYVVAAVRFPVLRDRWWLAGPAYGAGLYLVMNRVVVPLSAFPGEPFALNLPGLAVHMFFVGLPIALAAARWAPASRASMPAPAR
jgi:uncharacterized membrane protein YagU involved in acid resistance